MADSTLQTIPENWEHDWATNLPYDSDNDLVAGIQQGGNNFTEIGYNLLPNGKEQQPELSMQV
jgi:hypothetical protein